MSKLKELIEQLCPDGVEYKRLDELFDIRGGYTPSKKNPEFWEDGIHPWFVMEDIRRDGFVLKDSAAHVTDAALKKNGLFPAYSIIVATSATIGVHALVTVDFLCNQRFACMTRKPEVVDELDIHFAHQAFFALDKWCLDNTDLGNFATVNSQALKAYRIPVPPIEVQREIVRMLDSMQELDDALSEELKVRNEQMEATRSFLLDSYIEKRCPEGTNLRQLGEVAPFVRERANTGDSQFDAYVGVDTLLQNKQGRDMTKTDIPEGRHIYFRPGDTLLGNIRPYLKKIWFADCFGGTNGDVLVFRPCNDVNPKYLYYAVSSDEFFAYDNGKAKGSKMPRGDKGAIQEYEIPVPPIEIQREIAVILDSLQELSQSIFDEREQRRKQFEYYRDKLLDFPEKVA